MKKLVGKFGKYYANRISEESMTPPPTPVNLNAKLDLGEAG